MNDIRYASVIAIEHNYESSEELRDALMGSSDIVGVQEIAPQDEDGDAVVCVVYEGGDGSEPPHQVLEPLLEEVDGLTGWSELTDIEVKSYPTTKKLPEVYEEMAELYKLALLQGDEQNDLSDDEDTSDASNTEVG